MARLLPPPCAYPPLPPPPGKGLAPSPGPRSPGPLGAGGRAAAGGRVAVLLFHSFCEEARGSRRPAPLPSVSVAKRARVPPPSVVEAHPGRGVAADRRRARCYPKLVGCEAARPADGPRALRGEGAAGGDYCSPARGDNLLPKAGTALAVSGVNCSY